MPVTIAAIVEGHGEVKACFLASADSLREQGLIKRNADVPPDPESVRGAKEWLEQNLVQERYLETVDQPELARKFDLQMARKCGSFEKFWREVERLLGAAADP